MPVDADALVAGVIYSRTPDDLTWNIHTPDGAHRHLSVREALRLSSLLMVHEAVRAGVGVAMLPKLLVEDDVRAGRLVHWGTDDRPPVEIWALRNSRRLVGAKVRAFLDVLEQAFPHRAFVPAE